MGRGTGRSWHLRWSSGYHGPLFTKWSTEHESNSVRPWKFTNRRFLVVKSGMKRLARVEAWIECKKKAEARSATKITPERWCITTPNACSCSMVRGRVNTYLLPSTTFRVSCMPTFYPRVGSNVFETVSRGMFLARLNAVILTMILNIKVRRIIILWLWVNLTPLVRNSRELNYRKQMASPSVWSIDYGDVAC